jgi:Na+-driven multidrug efflux pump
MYLFVFRWELGMRGLATAAVCASWNCLVSTVVFVRLRKWYLRRHVSVVSLDPAAATTSNWHEDFVLLDVETWPPWSTAVFRDWSQFFQLGAPAAVSLVVEWGSFEVTAWLAGQLGATPLAVHVIFMNSASIWYVAVQGGKN